MKYLKDNSQEEGCAVQHVYHVNLTNIYHHNSIFITQIPEWLTIYVIHANINEIGRVSIADYTGHMHFLGRNNNE